MGRKGSCKFKKKNIPCKMMRTIRSVPRWVSSEKTVLTLFKLSRMFDTSSSCWVEKAKGGVEGGSVNGLILQYS